MASDQMYYGSVAIGWTTKGVTQRSHRLTRCTDKPEVNFEDNIFLRTHGIVM